MNADASAGRPSWGRARSDAFALRTRAERDGSGFRINGTKTFISNGPVADLVIVLGMTDPARLARAMSELSTP
jgi:alkylation response protein AidB-like acyl-CoA dehydrogenase